MTTVHLSFGPVVKRKENQVDLVAGMPRRILELKYPFHLLINCCSELSDLAVVVGPRIIVEDILLLCLFTKEQMYNHSVKGSYHYRCVKLESH